MTMSPRPAAIVQNFSAVGNPLPEISLRAVGIGRNWDRAGRLGYVVVIVTHSKTARFDLRKSVSITCEIPSGQCGECKFQFGTLGTLS